MISDNGRGALILTLSMGVFAINDALIKLAFQTVSVAQGLVVRSAVASVLIIIIAWRTGALAYKIPRSDRWPMILRMVGEVSGNACFLIALAAMPLANAAAILQAVPLALTMAAALILREQVGWRRWSAIAVGFAGVLIIIRPGSDGFDINAIFALAAVFCVTVRDIATRRLTPATPGVLPAGASALSLAVAGLVAVPFVTWTPMTLNLWALLAGAGVLVVVGYITNVASMRIGDVSAVSPFRYTLLVWAFFFSAVIFGDTPDALTLTGGAIVVSAGLYTLFREKVRGQDIATRSSDRPSGPGAND